MAPKSPEGRQATTARARVPLQDISNLLLTTKQLKNRRGHILLSTQPHIPATHSTFHIPDTPDTPDIPDTDVAATRELWDAVCQRKIADEMAYLPTEPAPFPGIYISIEAGLNAPIKEHFGQLPPAIGQNEGHALNSLSSVLVWDKPCPARATAAELSFTLQTYLVSASRNIAQGANALWVPERCLQGKAVPGANYLNARWHSPYSSEAQLADITFWLRSKHTPDSAFWKLLPRTTYTIDDDASITSPYLSVMIQDGVEDPKTPVERLKLAGGDALYNRACLHCPVAPKKSDAGVPDEIKHYGIVFSWSHFSLWEFKPKSAATEDSNDSGQHTAKQKRNATIQASSVRSASAADKKRNNVQPGSFRAITNKQRNASQPCSVGPATRVSTIHSISAPTTMAATADAPALQWHGAVMRCLMSGRSDKAADLSNLADWIRAVHAWGMTKYAAAVVSDVCEINDLSIDDLSINDLSINDLSINNLSAPMDKELRENPWKDQGS